MPLSAAFLLLGLVTHFDRSAQRATNTGPGIIAGVVVNAQREPVAEATVQAFPAPANEPREHAPFTTPAIGQATTDSQGRFRITGLPLGEYLVGARMRPSPPPDAAAQPLMYAATFYPSATDHQAAASVSAVADVTGPIQIALVQLKGVRISGSAVSSSGRPAAGKTVRLFHRFGGEGSESPVGVVAADGTFETPPLPPGWYQLTIGTRPDWEDVGGEFATTLLEVRDRDVDGVSLVLKSGASISGRIVAEAGAASPSAVGMRVIASRVSERYAMPRAISARVSADGSFRMTGLLGSYQFSVNADRQPFVQVTRVAAGGKESPATDGVEFVDGDHDVVVVVAPFEPRKSTVDNSLSTEALVERFKGEKVFFRQLEIAQQIVARHDPSVIPSLIGWLTHQDRHVRGNAAFIVGGLGDPRGFQVIADILSDRSDRPEGQGSASRNGRYQVVRQIATDRYYAVHLLGQLRDPQAVPILVSLLKDPDVNYAVPWALGQIGDKRGIGPLINALDDDSPSMRVMAIYGLEALNAKEALPRLVSLLADDRRTNFGAQVSVADAARAAIAKLR
jgi:HEAT repeats/Carboxypeptidase regulatory-like domain